MSSAQERGSSHPEPADVNSMPLLEAALAYAAMGLPVFPLHSPVFDAAGTFVRCDCREGAQCKDPGKHPWTLHGLSSATTNPDIIRRWWTRLPKANIGLRTGTRGGIVVLDADDDVEAVQKLGSSHRAPTGTRTIAGASEPGSRKAGTVRVTGGMSQWTPETTVQPALRAGQSASSAST